jgi:hypothetical protein
MTHHKVPLMYLSEVGVDVGLGTAGRFSTAQGIVHVGSLRRGLVRVNGIRSQNKAHSPKGDGTTRCDL